MSPLVCHQCSLSSGPVFASCVFVSFDAFLFIKTLNFLWLRLGPIFFVTMTIRLKLQSFKRSGEKK